MPEIPETIEPSYELIEEIINSGKADKLMHLEETAWLEFHHNYATTAPDPAGSIAKYELAKDCSAIANSGGGYIFTGVKTENINNRMTDYVCEVRGVQEDSFDLQSWRDSLSTMLIPRFTLTDIKNGLLDTDDGKKVLYLKIPDAKANGLYPIILRNDQWQPDEQHRIKGEAIGLYERYGAGNNILSAEKTQSYIAQGIENENGDNSFVQELKRLETKIDSLINVVGNIGTEPVINVNGNEAKFVEEAMTKLATDRNGFFYIYAAPKDKLDLVDFWKPYTEEDSIPRLMKNPPTLRRLGWDLSVGDQEYPSAEPGMWEIMNGESKILDITDKGELFTAGVFRRFIDWGLDPEVQRNSNYDVLINEYALSEYIGMFFAFLEKFVATYGNPTEQLKYQLHFGFVVEDGLRVGLDEPDMLGIPSNGIIGPLRSVSTWRIEECKPNEPDRNAGFVIQKIVRDGFGGTADPSYFTRDDGILTFDRTSYK